MLRWPSDKVVLKQRSVPAPPPATAPSQAAAPRPMPGAPAREPATSCPSPAAIGAQPAITGSSSEQRTIVCPHCQHTQSASAFGLSAFCKNCNRRINLAGNVPSRMPETVRASLRTIHCPGCQAAQDVPSNALSAFCPKCGKRINMQDYQIRGRFNGEIQTKGTLTVAMGGDVRADVRVGNAIIEGKLFGTIQADGKVELRSTGHVEGDILAPTIIVHDGAALLGKIKTLSGTTSQR